MRKDKDGALTMSGTETVLTVTEGAATEAKAPAEEEAPKKKKGKPAA